MGSFVAELLAGIEAGDDEAVLAACEYADAFRLEGFKPFPPFDERLRAEPPTAEGLAKIKEALLDNLKSFAQPRPRIYTALGKIGDPELVPVLRAALTQKLRDLLDQNGTLSTLIIALDNCGEKIVSGNSHGPMEMEKMVADARAYLKRFGQIFPW